MGIKYKFIGLLFLLIVVTTSFNCHKICIGTKSVYSFDIGIKAFPDKDSMKVGDTLHLIVNSPVRLMDQRTNTEVNYKGAVNLGTVISFARLIDTNNAKVATGNFNYELKTGKTVKNANGDKFKEYLFEEIDQTYQFNLAIVPQKVGVYKLFVSNAANVFRKNDKCTKAGFDINFKNTDQHLYYNKIITPNMTLPIGEGVYLFKVY